MSQLSSSISSSESSPTSSLTTRRPLREALYSIFYTAAFLGLFDLTVGQLIDHAGQGRVRDFFEAGRSIRWKLRKLIPPVELTYNPVVHNGWLEPPPGPHFIHAPSSDRDPVVTFYGLSFTDRLADQASRIEPSVGVRKLGGANASPNHTYAMYSADPLRRRSKAAVFGILANNVSGVLSRGMTWSFDAPPPYTQPLYLPRDGRLEIDYPSVLSLDRMRECLYNDVEWTRFAASMKSSDPFFDTYLFNSTVAGNSVLDRLVRKAWGQYRKQKVLGNIRTQTGFNPNSEAIQRLCAIVAAFGADAKKDGVKPIVVLFETQGYAGQLEAVLGATLRDGNIPFINSSNLFSTNSPRNYKLDKHYLDEHDEKIARAVLDLVPRQDFHRN